MLSNICLLYGLWKRISLWGSKNQINQSIHHLFALPHCVDKTSHKNLKHRAILKMLIQKIMIAKIIMMKIN